jgi:hypothetical protein
MRLQLTAREQELIATALDLYLGQRAAVLDNAKPPYREQVMNHMEELQRLRDRLGLMPPRDYRRG